MFQRIRRWFRRPSNPSGNVYYVRLATPQGKFYKLGYTTKSSLLERMAYGDFGDERLIDRQFLFTYRRDAWDIEQTLLEHFDKHRAFGKFSNDPNLPLAGRGQSELFAWDVLGLDEDLYRQSDEKLDENRKKELEEQGQGCLYVLVGLVLAPFTLGISLFFIAGGLSAFFSKSTVQVPTSKRPQHKPEIKGLLDALIASSE